MICVLYLATEKLDAAYAILAVLVALFFIGIIGGAATAFLQGPAKRAQDYSLSLAAQLPDVPTRTLFLNMYATKNPKNVVVAWLLTFFLSPTISYLYQAKWGLAAIAFLTLQGFGIWWIVSLFTMPTEVMSSNKRLADEAFQQIMLSGRGYAGQMPSHPAVPSPGSFN